VEIKTYRELAESELDKIRRGAVTVIVGSGQAAWTPGNVTRTNVMTDTNFNNFGKGSE
jgi:hypothetical protein